MLCMRATGSAAQQEIKMSDTLLAGTHTAIRVPSKPKGSLGSRFAVTLTGQAYACVQGAFVKGFKGHDTDMSLTHNKKNADRRKDQEVFYSMILTGRVLLTTDEMGSAVDPATGVRSGTKRTGYIGLFEVKDVVWVADGLHFTLGEPLERYPAK